MVMLKMDLLGMMMLMRMLVMMMMKTQMIWCSFSQRKIDVRSFLEALSWAPFAHDLFSYIHHDDVDGDDDGDDHDDDDDNGDDADDDIHSLTSKTMSL